MGQRRNAHSARASLFPGRSRPRCNEVLRRLADAIHDLAKSVPALGWDGDNVCSFEGVTCERGGSGKVTELNLADRALAGTLSSLTSLTALQLQGNALAGAVPSLAGMASLTRLALDGNAFTSLPPDFLLGLTSLQYLSIDNLPIQPWPVPDAIANCSSLETFFASNALRSGGGADHARRRIPPPPPELACSAAHPRRRQPGKERERGERKKPSRPISTLQSCQGLVTAAAAPPAYGHLVMMMMISGENDDIKAASSKNHGHQKIQTFSRGQLGHTEQAVMVDEFGYVFKGGKIWLGLALLASANYQLGWTAQSHGVNFDSELGDLGVVSLDPRSIRESERLSLPIPAPIDAWLETCDRDNGPNGDLGSWNPEIS
uniref:Receptor-like protein kinase-like n=1 Tax=Oryza sativa subsp. japonica TaxID=39947 RepID=Q84QV2_ORYSJ|nr:receptor-like protein kinase-like [Oryza sativa Japonica Group]